MKRMQLSTTIAKDIKQTLQHMAVDDAISVREMLERLIREEHQRRNERQRREAIVNPHYPDAAPARELVDASEPYRVEERA